jgi:hypothetical protein
MSWTCPICGVKNEQNVLDLCLTYRDLCTTCRSMSHGVLGSKFGSSRNCWETEISKKYVASFGRRDLYKYSNHDPDMIMLFNMEIKK